MVEEIKYNGQLLSIVIYSSFYEPGIRFFTSDEFSQQLGYMNRPQGYIIPPHRHNVVPREVIHTQEVLVVKSGKVRVDFYDDEQNYLESRILSKGDIILLAAGGHGLEMLEQSEIIEVKQGPYLGELDKVRFNHVEPHKIRVPRDEK